MSHRILVLQSWTVSSYDALTLRLLGTSSVGAPRNGAEKSPRQMAVDARRQRVFVLTNTSLVAINVGEGMAPHVMSTGQYAQAQMVLDGTTGRVFVAQPGGNCRGSTSEGGVKVFDAATGGLLRRVTGDYCFGVGAMLVDEAAHLVVVPVPGPSAQPTLVLNSRTGNIHRRVSNLPELLYNVVDRRSGLIYFAAQICTTRPQSCHDTVRVLDPHTWRVVHTIAVPHTWQSLLVADESAHRIFILSPYFDVVSMIQTR